MRVAAFDFDGTLTRGGDSLIAFVHFCFGRRRAIWGWCTLLPLALGYLFGKIDRKGMKEAVLTRFFRGKSRSELNVLGAAFAGGGLEKHLQPERMAVLQQHLKQGDRCVLISASLGCYLRPWAESQGFDAVFASELAYEGDPPSATGKLQGENCRGSEKARLLKEWLGDSRKEITLYAYGNSDGDEAMLRIADVPVFYGIRQ